ncbi:hypothetical protein Tco_0280784 [Tanacetum coccineum]
MPRTLGTHEDEARSSRSKCSRQHKTMEEAMLPRVHHPFLLWQGYWRVLNNMGCAEEIENMLEIKVYETGCPEEIFIFEARRRVFDINEPIYTELCHEFYSTYEFDEVCADHELRTKKNGYANVAWLMAKWLKMKGTGSQKDNMICCGQLITKIARKMRVLTDEVLNSLSAPTYCRALDTTTLRELIDSEGRLIPEFPALGFLRVSVPRGPRPSMQDLYDQMGSMEIRQGAI